MRTLCFFAADVENVGQEDPTVWIGYMCMIAISFFHSRITFCRIFFSSGIAFCRKVFAEVIMAGGIKDCTKLHIFPARKVLTIVLNMVVMATARLCESPSCDRRLL